MMFRKLFTVIWRMIVGGACFNGQFGGCSEAQDRLIRILFQDYDKLIRPVMTSDEVVTIEFGLTLNILVFVSDQEQFMKTNGYLDMSWNDSRFKWEPVEYGNITTLRLPIDKVWQPEIALVNTIDRNFYPNFKSNAVVASTGVVQWVPPFIFKSGCKTNPHYFPFDQQFCNMVFRSVTYDALNVDIRLKTLTMELKDYCEQPSGSWDVAEVPMVQLYRMEWRRDGEKPVVFVELSMKVARKSQFYVITLLLPCVCIAFVTIFVFYLPTGSGEKICLAISILFSIVVFLLILIDIVPPSDSLPLMTKFLVFTFVCNLTSMFITIITVNWNYRTPQSHCGMSPWLRRVFLTVLPRLLRIKRPERHLKRRLSHLKRESAENSGHFLDSAARRRRWATQHSERSRQTPNQSSSDRMLPENGASSPIVALKFPAEVSRFAVEHWRPVGSRINPGYSPGYQYHNQKVIMREIEQLGQWLGGYVGYEDALRNVAFIAKHMEEHEDDSEVADDWKYVAFVVDRLLLWVFFAGNAFGTVGILLNSPHLFERLIDHCPPRV